MHFCPSGASRLRQSGPHPCPQRSSVMGPPFFFIWLNPGLHECLVRISKAAKMVSRRTRRLQSILRPREPGNQRSETRRG